MEQEKQGEWRRLAQAHAEKKAARLARALWVAYWRKFDRQRRAKPKR